MDGLNLLWLLSILCQQLIFYTLFKPLSNCKTVFFDKLTFDWDVQPFCAMSRQMAAS